MQEGEVRNRALFSCPHVHVIHMPYAHKPYKLIRFEAGLTELRIEGFATNWGLRLRCTGGCECAKAWATLRMLRKAPAKVEGERELDAKA